MFWFCTLFQWQQPWCRPLWKHTYETQTTLSKQMAEIILTIIAPRLAVLFELIFQVVLRYVYINTYQCECEPGEIPVTLQCVNMPELLSVYRCHGCRLLPLCVFSFSPCHSLTLTWNKRAEGVCESPEWRQQREGINGWILLLLKWQHKPTQTQKWNTGKG